MPCSGVTVQQPKGQRPSCQPITDDRSRCCVEATAATEVGEADRATLRRQSYAAKVTASGADTALKKAGRTAQLHLSKPALHACPDETQYSQ
mmetsp:Transcript_39394/g.121595  ORF Transcript_39394/g.121595 Transcript_39394/m.121595 type:complete len:92 (+) Transcript_39394:260-535(+)